MKKKAKKVTLRSYENSAADRRADRAAVKRINKKRGK